MLTLKNICKTYRTKGGAAVKALDDVSVTFPETGMVFILGKSGSGKSTLLNVCGGLDQPDSGEIVICGRSSADFSGSDFDSYRNTFVGFIFQEYNILNEFSVEDNLALALELQGKGKNKEKVNELLRQVDLEGYAKRKPNTLSGGQKQRIAIARAIIKEPRIIMADEPTGALDSNTGKQVLDTLKKLSETRLVIVVSHDREFAEIYGDRVIELKDGKIISDVSKTSVAAEKLGENVSVIAENTLSVKSGRRLSDGDLRRIRDYISNADGDVIISRSQGDISSFKKANRIAEDGSTERFAPTSANVPVREYTAEESALVRSKLPAGKAIKMAASSLKVKKFRLFLTILLAVVAFIMFGIFSTLMNYDGGEVLVNSYAKSYYDTIPLIKNYNVYNRGYYLGELDYEYTSHNSTAFTDDDITALSGELGTTVLGVMPLSYGSATPYNVTTNQSLSRALNDCSVDGVTCAPSGSAYRDMVAGSYPEGSEEIAISSWYYTLLKTQALSSVTITDSTPALGSDVTINSESDVIGQYLCFKINGSKGSGYACYKITGVFNAGEMPAEFSGWNDSETCASWDDDTLESYNTYIGESMNKILLVSDAFCDNFIKTYGTSYYYSSYESETYFSSLQNNYSDDYGSINLYYASVYDPTDSDTLAVHMFDSSKTTISGHEVIVNVSTLASYVMHSVDALSEDDRARWVAEYSEKYADETQDAFDKWNYYMLQYETTGDDADEQQAEYHQQLYNEYNLLTETGYIMSYVYSLGNEINQEHLLSTEIYIELVLNYLNNYNTLSREVTLFDYEGNSVQVEIVGFHDDPDGEYANGFYITQSFYEEIKPDSYYEYSTNYTAPDDAIYSYAYVCYDGTESLASRIVALTDVVAADDSYIEISSYLYSEISFINSFVGIMSQVFLYVGIALAAFSALLLFNFISVSITSKTHEIGVLRAVGARGWDVFKIFFAEAAIITVSCLVISLIGTLILINYLNSVMSAGLGFSYVLFSFGALSLGMMVGVAVIVAVLGTFFPVFRISHKKPVDSMRTL